MRKVRLILLTCERFSACFWLALILFLASAPAFAADAYLRIPVFFVTDRNLIKVKGKIDFGPQRKYIGECKHDPYMGVAYCVVENLEHKEVDEHLTQLGWTVARPGDEPGDVEAEPIKAENFDLIQNDFYGRVHAQAEKTTDENIFVFAHGYKNTFKSGLHTASRLAYYAERPLIFYSWPSAARLRAYSGDECNVEWSQEHYNDVITNLDKISNSDPKFKVHLFAHSMGSRLLVRASPLLREKKFLLEAGLICPDIDDGVVKHYARRYLSENGTSKIRLYMSRRDKALALSQYIHGGYTRLGEQADAIADYVTRLISGEARASEESDTKAEDAELAERLKKASARMQTIDFTNIDHGLIGHNVPAKLICNMSFTDKPGEGLELVTESSGRRSKISNMFLRIAKLKDTDDTNIGGTVYLVKRTK